MGTGQAYLQQLLGKSAPKYPLPVQGCGGAGLSGWDISFVGSGLRGAGSVPGWAGKAAEAQRQRRGMGGMEGGRLRGLLKLPAPWRKPASLGKGDPRFMGL